jgi:hypothetical protein
MNKLEAACPVESAISTIESVSGFTDKDTPVGEAWTVVLGCLHSKIAKYNELLYAVARKFPGETRHDTALRYIQKCEAIGATSQESQHEIKI